MRRRMSDMEAKREGIHLESVGTWLHHDGWTYPIWADDTVTIPAKGASLDEQIDCEGHRLDEIDPNGEGYDWYEALSPTDRALVERVYDMKQDNDSHTTTLWELILFGDLSEEEMNAVKKLEIGETHLVGVHAGWCAISRTR